MPEQLKTLIVFPGLMKLWIAEMGQNRFSSLDLESGYWQVEMEEDSKAFTVFTVGPLGFYECECMAILD